MANDEQALRVLVCMQRRELELGEVQRKLAIANCTLSETVEARDARIVELESMLSRKHIEVRTRIIVNSFRKHRLNAVLVILTKLLQCECR